MKRSRLLMLMFFVSFSLVSCSQDNKDVCTNTSGEIIDEALCVNRTWETFPSADEDYYEDMDYGISRDPEYLRQVFDPYLPGISAEEAKKRFARGRNNWIVWTAGNDTLWDQLSRDSVGNLDLLKTVSNHPGLNANRDNRWQYLGVVNEPCFIKGDRPNPDFMGLYIDSRDPACGDDPFENEEKYPGVKIGGRGKTKVTVNGTTTTLPVGSYYGYGSGIVGLRLFPNPDFDEEAAKNWDPERYYTDKDYYNSKDLIKPFRVGMSCGFCHVGPNPSNPPADPEHPKWENLNSNPGAQYFWVDRVLMWNPDSSNFAWQLFHTSRPGALDTSFVSSDYINNPRTMNAVYNLAARLEIGTRFGHERLTGGSANNAQFNDLALPADSPLNQFYDPASKTVLTPHVLKDGADSVGALGALNRVFINIGLFSEEWTTHFRPLIGGKDITPFTIENARKNSAIWKANEHQTPDLALFFLAATRPDYLKNAPGGKQYLTDDDALVERGKEVFAATCARCHSSKQPEKTFTFFPDNGCVGPNYLECWDNYWRWTKTSEFKEEMRTIVKADDFLENNFLSTDLRIPVTLLETNICSPLATNALKGNIWDNFSSTSYKELSGVGEMLIQHPYTGETKNYEMPAGGRGYTRVPSLVSIWSSAPLLLNNSLGKFYWSGSVEDRMSSFEYSIEQLLWPEKREGDFSVVTRSGKTHPGIIDKTSSTSYLKVSGGYLPDFLSPLKGTLARWLPWLFSGDDLALGPIPAGTPVNLLSNIDMDQRLKVAKVLLKAKRNLKQLPENASDEQAREVFKDLVDPLIEVSKCPDYVVNKGHYFGTGMLRDQDEKVLSDEDKWALIEFLKTF